MAIPYPKLVITAFIFLLIYFYNVHLYIKLKTSTLWKQVFFYKHVSQIDKLKRHTWISLPIKPSP